jgi:ribosomal protein S18 acetylase RimI-like enzyme
LLTGVIDFPGAVVIVGAGPRGTGLLERLIANAPELIGERPLRIDLVDPYPPGAGRVWRHDQSGALRMNSMARDVTMFTDESVQMDGPIRPGPSFAEWKDIAIAEGLADADLAGELQALQPTSFPSRRLASEYLGWVYRRTVAAAPANFDIRLHRARVTGVADTPDGRQRVDLDDGNDALVADFVVLALGHLDVAPDPDEQALLRFAAEHELHYIPTGYTADVDLTGLAPRTDVIVRGFGLAFVDLMALVTQGRGGRFVTAGNNGRVDYVASGNEPRLWVGSRRGIPYHSKTGYPLQGPRPPLPRFFSPDTIGDVLAARDHVDFKTDVWPLMAKEIAWGYYHELFAGHPDRVTVDVDTFSERFAAVAHGSDDERRLIEETVPDTGDHLDLVALDRPLRALTFTSFDALQDHVRGYIEADVARRGDARYSADLGAFVALLSVFGQVPRIANSPKLAPESRLEDVDGWWFGFFNYLASGPPPDRLQQMLALERAGIVRFVGPDMWLEADAEQGVFRAGSAAVDHVIEACALVDARLPEASVNACVEPLVRDLSERGATVEEVLVGSDGRQLPTGRLKVDREFRVVDRDGRPHRRRLAIGAYATMRSPAFARPRTNAPGFRHNDTIARGMLRAMTDDHPLDNPAWHALTTHHADVADGHGRARRYRSDVSVFSAVDRYDDESWNDLATLHGPGRGLVVFGPEVPNPPDGWTPIQRMRAHQMVAGDLAPVAEVDNRPLTTADVPQMIALVELAKPGPFLPRTIELGSYYGVFEDEQLVAMAGERIHLPGHTEVSAVATHPDHRGRGLAAALTRYVSAGIAARDEVAFLHVVDTNVNAIRVYERLGFTTRVVVDFVILRTPGEGRNP